MPTPPWLSWFGTEYADEVGPHLSFGSVQRLDRGLFHRTADELADRAGLARLLTPATSARRRRWLGLREPRQRPTPEPIAWLPIEYLAVTPPQNSPTHPTVEAAPTLPRTLRT